MIKWFDFTDTDVSDLSSYNEMFTRKQMNFEKELCMLGMLVKIYISLSS